MTYRNRLILTAWTIFVALAFLLPIVYREYESARQVAEQNGHPVISRCEWLSRRMFPKLWSYEKPWPVTDMRRSQGSN